MAAIFTIKITYDSSVKNLSHPIIISALAGFETQNPRLVDSEFITQLNSRSASTEQCK